MSLFYKYELDQVLFFRLNFIQIIYINILDCLSTLSQLLVFVFLEIIDQKLISIKNMSSKMSYQIVLLEFSS